MKKIFEGYYITEDGRIWSSKSNKFIAQRISPKGYYVVNLSINKHCKTYQVHNLIAIAFIPNPNNYNVINHKDGNKLNNNINNLEWCTQKYNMQHAFKNNLINVAKGIRTKNGHFNEKDINNIRLLRQQGLSQYSIAKKYNVTKEAIQQILSGNTYKWV